MKKLPAVLVSSFALATALACMSHARTALADPCSPPNSGNNCGRDGRPGRSIAPTDVTGPDPDAPLPKIAAVTFQSGGYHFNTSALAPLSLNAIMTLPAGKKQFARSGELQITRLMAGPRYDLMVPVAKIPLTLAPGELKVVPFVDPTGANACARTPYLMVFYSPQGGAGGKGIVTSTCEFAATPSSPWSGVAPDRRYDRTKNQVYIGDVVVTNGPSCGGKLSFRVPVKNNTAAPALALTARISHTQGGKTTLQTVSPPVNVGRGASATIVVDAPFYGDDGSYVVDVVSGLNVLAPIVGSGFSLNVTHACTLHATMDQ